MAERPTGKIVEKKNAAAEATRNIINGNNLKSKKKKYAVNVVFNAELEEKIRNKASDNGVGVATYIKMLVNQDINK